jgi:hypothetical protein
MADLIVQLAIGGLVLAALWYALRPQYVFTLAIEPVGVRKASGTVTRAFVHEVEEVCRREGLTGGRIVGVRHGRSIVLAFSGPIPPTAQQQLRNLWQINGSLR